ncbi:MAG: hypothetical protein HY716_11385 [Planctomycetes bacterium]|nr:hypothetical protein [Planctomycetota bacterium]
MRWSAAAACFVLAIAPAQELNPDVLDRLKSAAVFVVVETRGPSSSGFLPEMKSAPLKIDEDVATAELEFKRGASDQSRLYVGDTALSPGKFHCVVLRKEKNRYPVYKSPYHGQYALGGDCGISPDGRFLVAQSGIVLRLSKTREADLRYMSKIESWVSIAMTKRADTFFTCTWNGFVKAYSLSDFELKKSIKIDRICGRLILDARRDKLYAVARRVPVPGRRGTMKTHVPPYKARRFLASDRMPRLIQSLISC